MHSYIMRRLLLLPITLFCILLVNFVIINLAPGDPVTVTEVSAEGLATRSQDKSIAFGSDERYLQFREYYGLTLPILYNDWPWLSMSHIEETLWQLQHRRYSPQDAVEMSFKTYDQRRVLLGDQSCFIMPKLLSIAQDPLQDMSIRRLAVGFFIRGATRQAYLGPNLTDQERAYNRKISHDNALFALWPLSSKDSAAETHAKISQLQQWYAENYQAEKLAPTGMQKVSIFFFETRLVRYMSRVLTLDFGTLRNDPNKTVLEEVVKRFKYSLTLALFPMLITFVVCQFFGFLMAYNQGQGLDIFFNYTFLILYAIPIFVVAPFLIENVALNNFFPFTHTPIPISGFTSPEAVYATETSLGRLFDLFEHIALPLVAIIYGSLAAEARLSRTAVIEVMRQDYVRTAKAKGLSSTQILFKHIGRNAGITIVTSIAGSLGIVLGGSLIVETLFEINGFGKFFYDAVINRDYNVIMFSAIAGSLLTLIGYLLADIAYTLLDPRVTLD